IAVLNPGGLDPVVHQPLDSFPDAIAPGLDHHAAANARFLGHLRFGNHLLIPLGEIVLARDGKGVANGGHGSWLPESLLGWVDVCAGAYLPSASSRFCISAICWRKPARSSSRLPS